MMAYANMFRRDITRLEDCRARLDECPLGSGALATSTHPVDRFQHGRAAGLFKTHGQLPGRGVRPGLCH